MYGNLIIQKTMSSFQTKRNVLKFIIYLKSKINKKHQKKKILEIAHQIFPVDFMLDPKVVTNKITTTITKLFM